MSKKEQSVWVIPLQNVENVLNEYIQAGYTVVNMTTIPQGVLVVVERDASIIEDTEPVEVNNIGWRRGFKF